MTTTNTAAASGAASELRTRLERIHSACMDLRPKQAVGEMIAAMLEMPEWAVLAAAPAQPVALDWKDAVDAWMTEHDIVLTWSAYDALVAATVKQNLMVEPAAPVLAGEYPELPEWSKRDDLGGLVPSEVRQALRAYVDADRAQE